MKTAEYISFIIDRLPNGYVFTYANFITEVNQKEAVIKALNRMVASGKSYQKANTTNLRIRPLATYYPIRHK